APPPPDAARRPGAPPPAPVVRAAAPPPGGPPPPIYTAATRNSPTPSRLLSRLGERGPQVERHQRQKLLVVHIRDGALRSGPQDLAGQPLLVLDHPVDPLLHRAPAHQLVHEDVLLLPDAERAIGRLILDRRVPPPVGMDDVARRREVEPDAARLQRQDEERHPRVVLEPIAQLLAPAQLRVAVEDQPRAAEAAARNAASGSVISRNCVNTSAFSCLAAMTSAISRRRLNLPLASGSNAPSPSQCDGWLQICFRRMRNARTTPRRWIPSSPAIRRASSSTLVW